jgi:prolyl-tRNA synthetase
MDKDPAVGEALERVERELEAAGLSVLSDDRDERPGVKFNDADLLGMPIRLTVSTRNLKTGVVELKARDADEASTAPLDGVVAAVREALSD